MAQLQQQVMRVDLIKMDKGIGDLDKSNNREVPEQGFNRLQGGREGIDSFRERVRWTKDMMKLLITAVSYAITSTSFDVNITGKTALLDVSKMLSKWKAVSMVMVGRGYVVSPQQCESKFGDIYKRFKRLNEILGKGTCCNVVEDPRLLEKLELPVGAKDEVRKILSSKNLFYQEMCSYHNSNRLSLPHDWAVYQSLQLALEGKCCNGPQLESLNNPYNFEKLNDYGKNCDGFRAKRQKQLEHEVGGFTHVSKMKQRVPRPLNDCANANQQMMSQQQHELYIQEQMLVLKKSRLEMLMYNKKEDEKLDKMRLENEEMRLENMRLELEIKRQEMCAKSSKV